MENKISELEHFWRGGKQFNTYHSPCQENKEITQVLIKAAEKSIPKNKHQENENMNIWWNEETASVMMERKRARRKWKRCNNVTNKVHYKANVIAHRRKSWKQFVGTKMGNTSAKAWKNFKAIGGNTNIITAYIRDRVQLCRKRM